MLNRYLRVGTYESISLTGGNGSVTASSTGSTYVHPVKNYTSNIPSSDYTLMTYNESGGIVIGISGIYAISGSATVKLSVNRIPNVAVMSNGVYITSQDYNSTTTAAVSVPVFYIGSFSAGDVITLRAGCNYLDSGATATISNGSLKVVQLNTNDSISFAMSNAQGAVTSTETGICRVDPIYIFATLSKAAGNITNYKDGTLTIGKSCTLSISATATIQIGESRYPMIVIMKNGTSVGSKEHSSATTNATSLTATATISCASGDKITFAAGSNYVNSGVAVKVTNASITVNQV